MPRIIYLNICCLPNLVVNQNGWNDQKWERIRLFFTRIAVNYDIVVLCEVWNSYFHIGGLVDPLTVVEKIRKRCGFNYAVYVPRSENAWYHVVNSGLYIASRFPIPYYKQHVFRSTSGYQTFVPNAILHAKIRVHSISPLSLPSNFVSVFVYHVSCGVKDSSFLNNAERAANVQYEQGKEVHAFISEELNSMKKSLSSNTYNVVVLADGNVCALNENICGKHGSSLIWSKFKQALDLPSIGLRHIPTGVTYPNPMLNPSYLINKKCVGEQQSIDHCFTNIDTPFEIETIFVKENGIYLSDHAAISFIN